MLPRSGCIQPKDGKAVTRVAVPIFFPGLSTPFGNNESSPVVDAFLEKTPGPPWYAE